jgi:hypothetical protein
LAEARLVGLECLHVADLNELQTVEPPFMAIRIVATMALARVAAALNDRAEAVRYARAGLSLWSEARLETPGMRQLRNFDTWESWARGAACGALLASASGAPRCASWCPWR